MVEKEPVEYCTLSYLLYSPTLASPPTRQLTEKISRY